jgi:hypothetical protein
MKRLHSSQIGLLTLILGWAVWSPFAQAAEQTATATGNCRFGVTSVQRRTDFEKVALGAGNFLDWGLMPAAPVPSSLDYIHVVRLRTSQGRFVYDDTDPQTSAVFEATVRAAVEQFREGYWLIGNEPDTTFENQDSLSPDQYALAYRNLYHLIKSSDSAAQIGIGTIVQPTPLRLQWLDKVWDAYQARYKTTPPADFWSIHSFILRENVNDWGTGIPLGIEATSGELYTLEQTDDLEIFKSRIVAFRVWLADHGQRQKPLWITEYGSLLPHDSQAGFATQPIERARDYMLATFDYLSSARDPDLGYSLDGDHLVQRWFWYSLDDHLWRFGGSLFDPDQGQRTLIGDAYAAYVAQQARVPELHLSASQVRAWPHSPNGPMLVQVTVSNWGTAATTQPYHLSWYTGEPGRVEELVAGPVTVTAPLRGCGSVKNVVAILDSGVAFKSAVFVRLESDDLSAPIIAPFNQ